MTISDIINRFNEKIKARGYQILKTGFREIDAIIQGLKPGELYVVGAPPAMGKTAFMLSLIRNISLAGASTAFYTLNDSEELMFLSRIANNLQGNKTTGNTRENLMALAGADLFQFPMHLFARPCMDLVYIRENCKRLVKEEGIQCIFIESLQTLWQKEQYSDNPQGMNGICTELKLLALELNVPIIVTSELGKGAECRKGHEGKQPQLKDLPFHDAIEAIADSIWFIYRPSYYRILSDEKGQDLHDSAIIHVEKNKYGATGSAYLKFDKEKCIFDNMTC